MRNFVVWLLGADGIFLLLYGLLSLLLVPGRAGDAYFSSSRWLYGVIPAIMGATSLFSCVWVCIAGMRGGPEAKRPPA